MQMKIIKGNFIEGEYVSVIMFDGNTIRRKVYYDKTAGDLFIWYKGYKYFYYELINVK